ncbi:hypothetical protein GVAMD_0588 [Gardnerella vaginalis AMD]|nr:hypothetical protein GVAMD_0588 [Gardnerella vaginalis AMD]
MSAPIVGSFPRVWSAAQTKKPHMCELIHEHVRFMFIYY